MPAAAAAQVSVAAGVVIDAMGGNLPARCTARYSTSMPLPATAILGEDLGNSNFLPKLPNSTLQHVRSMRRLLLNLPRRLYAAWSPIAAQGRRGAPPDSCVLMVGSCATGLPPVNGADLLASFTPLNK